MKPWQNSIIQVHAIVAPLVDLFIQARTNILMGEWWEKDGNVCDVCVCANTLHLESRSAGLHEEQDVGPYTLPFTLSPVELGTPFADTYTCVVPGAHTMALRLTMAL